MTQLTRLIPNDRIIRLQGAIIIAVALLFAGLLGSRFFSLGNFQSIASQLPILGLLALGMGITMLTGGINLSIIAGANACSLVMAAIIVSHPDQPLFLALALVAGLLVAVAIGALNGALVAWIGVSPILASLGTMTLITGLNILLSNGAVISGFPAAIQFLGNGAVLGVPVALILFLLVAAGLWLLLEHTTLGRSLYLIGSNEQATRFSGVNTARVQVAVYILSALLGWGAALLMMAKFNSAKAGYGESYLLVTILASVLGGINPDGGFGRILGLVLALIVWQRPNLLLLDEPTNHLDLDMRQALTEALIDFEGALVVVSHDRHLLRSTTDDLYLVHDGQVEPFEGDLDDYQQWLVDLQRQESQQDAPEKESGGNSAQARKDQKRREAEFRTQTQPLRKQIARLEQQMEKLGAELAAVEEQLADPALYDISRKAELTDCLQKQSQAKSALEETEMTWLDAQEQLEQLTQAFEA